MAMPVRLVRDLPERRPPAFSRISLPLLDSRSTTLDPLWEAAFNPGFASLG